MPQRYTTKTGQVMVFPDDAMIDEIQAIVDEAEGVKEGKSLSGFGRNLASSAAGLVQPILHPIETAKGMGRMIAHPIDSAKSIGKMYGDRYGSLDAIGNTLYEDPLGALADASTVLGGGGAALKAASWGTKTSKAGRAASAVLNASDAIDPMRAVVAPLKAGSSAGTYIGEAGMGRAVGPPRTVLERMPGARKQTLNEQRIDLGRISDRENLPPTGRGLHDAMKRVQENTAAQQLMESRAANASEYVPSNVGDELQRTGRTVNARDVFSDMSRGALTYQKQGDVIPSIRKTTRPGPRIEATKQAIRETVEHPDLSVPYADFRSPRGADLLPRDPVNVLPHNARVPNPAVDPRVLGDIVRGKNTELIDAFGIDPKTTAEIVVDKNFTRSAGKRLDEVTSDFAAQTGPYKGKTRSEIGQNSHELLSLIDAYRNRVYDTAKNPVRLYEFVGASTGQIEPLMLGSLSRPPVLWHTSRAIKRAANPAQYVGGRLMNNGIDNVADFVSGLNTNDLARALLLARMGQQRDPQE